MFGLGVHGGGLAVLMAWDWMIVILDWLFGDVGLGLDDFRLDDCDCR